MKQLLAVSLLALLPGLAMAVPMTIVATPTDGTSESGTPLRHNLFHDASSGGGANGDVLAWFDLDATMSSTWDPDTGALSLYVNLFDSSGLNNQIGSAVGTSDNLLGSAFGDFDDSLIGTITWQIFDLAEQLLGTITMEFYDHQYPGDSQGNVPNSYVNNTVTLWGAHGSSNGAGFFDDAALGVDLVFVVPEPSVLMLMALGLLGIAVSVRRR